MYKVNLEREWYCTRPLYRDHHRFLFRLRSCSLSLAVETGLYTKPKTPLTERLCRFCDSSTVGDDKRFLLDCELYTDIRYKIYERVLRIDKTFNILETGEKLRFIMQHKTYNLHLEILSTKCLKKRKMFTQTLNELFLKGFT